MFVTKKDLKFLRRGEELRLKWLANPKSLKPKEFREVNKIQNYFLKLCIRTIGKKELAKKTAKNFVYLTYAARQEFYEGYFYGFFELLRKKHGLENDPQLGPLTDREFQRLRKFLREFPTNVLKEAFYYLQIGLGNFIDTIKYVWREFLDEMKTSTKSLYYESRVSSRKFSLKNKR